MSDCWIVEMVGLMADWWADKMAVTRDDSRAVKIIVKMVGSMVENWIV